MAASYGGAAALVGGTLTLATVSAGLAFAGGALSLIGNISGNRTISKIGMIAGIAGGVGMLADFAMTAAASSMTGMGEAAAAGSEAAASAPLAGTPAASAASGPVTPVVDGVAQSIPVAEPSAIVARPLAPLSSPGAAAGAVNAPGGAGVPLAGGAPPASVGAPAISLPGDATAPLALQPATDAMVVAANRTIDPIGSLYQQMGGAVDPSYASNIRNMTGLESAWEGTKSFGQGALNLVKENPMAAMMIGQSVGGISEWLSGVPDAELDALQSQVGLNDARAMAIQEEIAREKQRRANLNAGYVQVNAGVQVNPNVMIPMPWQQQQQQQQQQPQAGGLIAGARTPTAGV
jgi:hypothetical protein